MHLDEKTPHLHIDYIPIADGLKVENILAETIRPLEGKIALEKRINAMIDSVKESTGIQNHIDELTPKQATRKKSYDYGR